MDGTWLSTHSASGTKSASMSLNPLETPLNIALLLAIAHYARQVVLPSAPVPKLLPSEHSKGYNWIPASHPDVSVFKTYTPKTLEPFNGKDGSKILLAIDRKVFDVTAGRNFYGPGTYDPAVALSCVKCT
jgi:membrane-associated progesterone receptor component